MHMYILRKEAAGGPPLSLVTFSPSPAGTALPDLSRWPGLASLTEAEDRLNVSQFTHLQVVQAPVCQAHGQDWLTQYSVSLAGMIS